MKISEYSGINHLSKSDIFLVDGVDGTRTINVQDAILSMLHLMSSENHRSVVRGKFLGNVLTTEQKAAIQNGTFDNLWLGDYWTINGVNWRIVDFDYWSHRGDTPLTKHHLAIMPDNNIDTGYMNSTDVTTGGYAGSAMHATVLDNAKNIIEAAFPGAVLTRREQFTNSMATGGYPNSSNWYDSDVELPNEVMMFGCYIQTPANTGDSHKRTPTNFGQLAFLRACPWFIVKEWSWLRDPVSSSEFAIVTSNGLSTRLPASTVCGIRPVFAIG